MTFHILVVEDSDEIGAPLVRTLEREGYAVTWVETGEAGLDHVADHEVDLMILDLGLPDIDGLEVCRSSRARGYAGGIMICTARGEELDRVVGLDYGADDYLPKPFGLAELHARVRALLRRTAPRIESSTTRPDLGVTVDRSARRVTFAGDEIALTNKEYDVLAMLTESPGSVVSRETMMSEVWDEHWFGSTKTLDVTVGRLRQKLELAGVPDSVITVRGVGFRLDRGKVDA